MKPYIILGAEKNCCVRSRFDLAHELGHSVMHFNIRKEDRNKHHRIIEKQANRFASAFLMPASSFASDVYTVSLDNFVYLKRKWKVSISAMVRRCYDLNIINEEQYTYLNKSISARGWKRNEPLDDELPFEKPVLFKQAFDLLLSKKIVNPEECVHKIALKPAEIENICFLDDGYFRLQSKDSHPPQLRVISRNHK